MRGAVTVADWQRAVMKDRRITARTKTVLLFLATRMKASLKVSVPRPTMAANTGLSERTIDRAIAQAREVGFLDVVVAGRKYVTAVYIGTVPDASQRATSVALNDVSARQKVGTENCHGWRAENAETGSQRATRWRTSSYTETHVDGREESA